MSIANLPSRIVSQWMRWLDLGLLTGALLIDDLYLSGTHRYFLTLPAVLVVREFARFKREGDSLRDALEILAVDLVAAALMAVVVWWLAGGAVTFDFIPLWLGSRILVSELALRRGRLIDTIVVLAATAAITSTFGRLDRTLAAMALVAVVSWLTRHLEQERPGFLARWPSWCRGLLTTVIVAGAAILLPITGGLGHGNPAIVIVVLFYLALGYWLTHRLAEHMMEREAVPRQVQLAFVLVMAGSYYIISPYLCPSLLGSGESYHYALQLGDFLTQFRHGVFPVLVGVSKYAFNGNVHTIRTAPYYTMLGGLLDLVTLRTLGLYTLENLTAVLSLFGGALAAFFVLKRLMPRLPWLAALLALLYVSCPGVIGPLMGNDMFATQMILPWLPIFFASVVESLRELDDRRPLAIAVFSLAVIWWAHPPVAIWVSGVFLLSRILRLLLLGRARGEWQRQTLALLAFSVMTAYVFSSVYSLHLRDFYNPDVPANLMVNLRLAWPGDLRPLSPFGSLLSDLQLGYGLMVIAMLGLYAFCRAPLPAAMLYLTVGFLLLLLVPTGLTAALWRWIPYKVTEISNIWPMQRLYLPVATALVFAGALALPGWAGRGRVWLIGCHVVLAAACLWSMKEVTKFKHRAESAVAAMADMGGRMLQGENIALTRSSYLIFTYYPPYYSHGVMDPAFENRLLDAHFNLILDNASALERKNAALSSLSQPLNKHPVFILNAAVPGGGALPPASSYLFVFDFPGPISGTLELSGDRGLFRRYYLPTFGERLAFGSEPGASHIVPVTPDHRQMETVAVNLTPPSGGSVRVIPCHRSDFPIKLTSLWPFTVEVKARPGDFLETPKMTIPGYAATVNGKAVKVVSSPAGLIAVPLHEGLNTVVLTYPGPRWLKPIFWLSFLGLIIAPFGLKLRCMHADSRLILGADIRSLNLLAGLVSRKRKSAT